jgi:hypothetical protein
MLPGGIGGMNTRVALVHFSSNDFRSRVEWNLKSAFSPAQIQNTLNTFDVSSILGVSDLDLYVSLFFHLCYLFIVCRGLQLTVTNVFVPGQDRLGSQFPNYVILIAEGLYVILINNV